MKTKNVTFWLKKRHIKDEKHITQMDFAEYLRKSDVPENSKVYYDWFLQNGLQESYFYISKSTWDVHDLEKSSSQSRDEGVIEWSKLESPFQCPYVYYVSALLSVRFHVLVTISYYSSFIKFRKSE